MSLYKKGFTLLELLIVIAIIGLLASVILVAVDDAREKGRDSRRIQDMKEIKKALALYYDANGRYPAISSPYDASALSAALVPQYINAMPSDPSNQTSPNTYRYISLSTMDTFRSYSMTVKLERNAAICAMHEGTTPHPGWSSTYATCPF